MLNFLKSGCCILKDVRGSKGKNVTVSSISPMFKLIFVTVLGLTVASLIILCVMSIACSNMTQPQISLFETCSTTWKMGFGAIVGLIGGKAT